MATSALPLTTRASRATPAPTRAPHGTARGRARGERAAGSGLLALLVRLRDGWRRGVHRAVAVLVLCSLSAFQLEALLADVCDGDATPAELAAFAGPASDLPRDAVQTAEQSAVQSAVQDATTGAAAEVGRSAPARLPAHGAHVCHCVHAHGGVLPTVEKIVATTVALSTTVPSLRHLAPPSVTREPRLRPPLA